MRLTLLAVLLCGYGVWGLAAAMRGVVECSLFGVLICCPQSLHFFTFLVIAQYTKRCTLHLRARYIAHPTDRYKKDTHMKKHNSVEQLVRFCGFARIDAERLRKDSMILHRWYELECGDDRGCVERDEATGKTYWRNAMSGRLTSFPDRETPARKRIDSVIARYPGLSVYHQTDPRGCALYVIRPGDVPEGGDVRSFYNRGVAVY